jgi:hypothetical protein
VHIDTFQRFVERRNAGRVAFVFVVRRAIHA